MDAEIKAGRAAAKFLKNRKSSSSAGNRATGNIFQRGVQGWTDWVREVVSFGQAGVRGSEVKRVKKPKLPDLKTNLKPANKPKLRRNLLLIRRPQPKEEAGYEMVQMKRENPKIEDIRKKPKTVEEALVRKVNPPRPFDIDEQYLETPGERKDRVERFKKKSL